MKKGCARELRVKNEGVDDVDIVLWRYDGGWMDEAVVFHSI